MKSPECGSTGCLSTSDRLEIVARERNVSVGIFRGRNQYEFSHRLRLQPPSNSYLVGSCSIPARVEVASSADGRLRLRQLNRMCARWRAAAQMRR